MLRRRTFRRRWTVHVAVERGRRAPAALSAALLCRTAMAKREAHAERLLPQGARGALHGLYDRFYGRLVSGGIPQPALVFFGPRTPCSTLFRFSRHSLSPCSPQT